MRRQSFGLSGSEGISTADVVLPAVIGATQAAFLVAAEPERDPAVRAELVDEAEAAAAVAEGDQRFRQELHAHRRRAGRGQLGGE